MRAVRKSSPVNNWFLLIIATVCCLCLQAQLSFGSVQHQGGAYRSTPTGWESGQYQYQRGFRTGGIYLFEATLKNLSIPPFIGIKKLSIKVEHPASFYLNHKKCPLTLKNTWPDFMPDC